jgi:hypothetical protein
MGQVPRTLLPVAVGVAISPIPIVAVILMLITPRARSNGTGFLLLASGLAGACVGTGSAWKSSGVAINASGGRPSAPRVRHGTVTLGVKGWR